MVRAEIHGCGGLSKIAGAILGKVAWGIVVVEITADRL